MADDSRINGNRRDERLAITDPPRCVLYTDMLTDTCNTWYGKAMRNDRVVAGERKEILANVQKEARRNRERRKGLR